MSGIKTTIGCFVAALFIAGGVTLNILFTDGMYSSKGSYKYVLTISSEAIGSFPVLGAVTEPVYFYSSRDGTAPSVQKVSYTSDLGREFLGATIQSFLTELGFRKGSEFFVKGNESIKVSLDQKTNNLIEVGALSTGN